MTQPKLFVSYSHKNEEEKDGLLSHLKILERIGLIDLWNDDRIRGGSDWRKELNVALTSAKVAILLISADFLTSDFILSEEVPILLKRREREGLTIFPLIAKPCSWKKIDWLTAMNVRPKNGKPIWGDGGSHIDEDLSSITEEIAATIEQLNNDASMNNIAWSSQYPAIRIYIAPWIFITAGRPKLPDQLLFEQEIGENDQPFWDLRSLLVACVENGLFVEVYNEKEQTLERISRINELWVMLISALVIDSESQGPLKWLVKETIATLAKQKIDKNSVMYLVWHYIYQRYCNHSSIHYRSKVLDEVSATAIDIAGTNHAFLYRFFTFLYENLEFDTLSVRRIVELLNSHDEALGNKAPPKYLERIKYLIGTGTAIAIHGITDIPSFDPKLVPIYGSKHCDYEFEAMVYPLTVYDYSSIRGITPSKIGENPALPYVFKIISEEGSELFNLLASEVLSLVNLCRLRERNDHYEWDIPTQSEWLALADCETHPYPWGKEFPTPRHANLDFGLQSKLRPVGTYPYGMSKFGTQDCCGNVHEIVRIAKREQFPTDFRLAGGCYQTNVQYSSCQIIRQLKRKSEDNRRNVGLRLVRYLKQEANKRFQNTISVNHRLE